MSIFRAVSLLRHGVAVVVFTLLTAGCTLIEVDERTDSEHRVRFVTDRDAIAPAGFGTARGGLTYGRCRVSPLPGRVAARPGPGPLLVPTETHRVSAVDELGAARFWDDWTVACGGPDPLLYVHGYLMDFEKSCRRAARLGRVTGAGDRLALFSWPSDGNVLSYTQDEADARWAAGDLEAVLSEVAVQFGPARLDLVAHSLGARLVLDALERIAGGVSGAPVIDELVLIAPDVDPDVFKRQLRAVQRAVRSITLYVSATDSALKISAELHGGPRLGQPGPHLAGLRGVEVIDVTAAGRAEVTGHRYHLYHPAVVRDLSRLLNAGHPAALRAGLTPVQLGGVSMWELRGD